MMPGKPDRTRTEACFYGTATVGERGQIVIPADARKEIGIQPGDKLLIWKHPSEKGLMLFHVEAVREFMNMILESLEHADKQVNDPLDSDDAALP